MIYTNKMRQAKWMYLHCCIELERIERERAVLLQEWREARKDLRKCRRDSVKAYRDYRDTVLRKEIDDCWSQLANRSWEPKIGALT